VTSYLFSWLKEKFGALDLAAFERSHPYHWLVWEAGQWHPPERSGQTLIASAALEPPGPGESLAIAMRPDARRPYLTMGRGAENDIVVDDATLSRVHLMLMRTEGGGWTVRDAGSSNGTRLEGALLGVGKPEALKSGARLQAGSVHFTYLEPRDLLERLKLKAVAPR